MPKVTVLVSKLTRLLISLHNEGCEFTITDDFTTVLFETAGNAIISSIHLQLSNSQRQLIQSHKIPCHTAGRVSSVRVDALYPFVFGHSEEIECVSTMFPTHQSNDDRATFGLHVKLIFDGELSTPTLTKINSVCLDIESDTVSVAKEVLGASSEFFANLFYGDFMEKSSGSFCIKEVDEKDFVWLVDSLMERNWKVTSVDQALAALTLADRFCMLHAHKRIQPYLKATELDPIAENRVAALKRYIELAVKCGDNGEFVSWILERCQTTAELIEVAQSCGKSLNPHMDFFFQFLSVKQSDEEKKTAEKIEQLEKEKAEAT